MDAFSSRSVPAHLATYETYARLREIVSGPVYVNLIDTPAGVLVRGVREILDALYPHVEAVAGPEGQTGLANTVFTASPAPVPALDALPSDYRITSVAAGQRFTDDRSYVAHR